MLVIGIAGGSGSGKTSVVKKIIQSIPKEKVSVLSQDAYYKDNGHLPQEEKEKINFDHPSAIEWPLLVHHIDELRDGKTIEMPTYSYVTCARGKDTIPVNPCDVLIVEGILIFTDKPLCRNLDIIVFVDTDADERLIRIIQRDVVYTWLHWWQERRLRRRQNRLDLADIAPIFDGIRKRLPGEHAHHALHGVGLVLLDFEAKLHGNS